jgi:hypothetical protein
MRNEPKIGYFFVRNINEMKHSTTLYTIFFTIFRI